MIKVAFHPSYIYPLPQGHRFPMEKYGLLKEQLLYEGTLEHAHFFEPEPAELDLLKLTHTESYLDKLFSQTLSSKEIRKIGFPMTIQLVERGRHIANGTFLGAKEALFKNTVALNIAGGTHHSFADRGEGFCVFNDIAIAVNGLLHEKLVQKVLIVDLDVHQGNGTAKIFENDDRVFTFSMHGEKNYPLQKEKSSLDIGLPDHTDDSRYLNILQKYLPRLIDEVEPDILFYQSGVDVLHTDKLGRLSLSLEGCKLRDFFVIECCFKNNIPLSISMGGGYSPDIRQILEAHANTYRVARHFYD